MTSADKRATGPVAGHTQAEIENEFVLAAVQALVGVISPNMLAVSVEVRSTTSICFYFAIATEVARDLEEVHDFPLR